MMARLRAGSSGTTLLGSRRAYLVLGTIEQADTAQYFSRDRGWVGQLIELAAHIHLPEVEPDLLAPLGERRIATIARCLRKH